MGPSTLKTETLRRSEQCSSRCCLCIFPTRLKSTRDTETLENMRLRPFETTRLTIFEKVLSYAASGHLYGYGVG